MSEPTETVRSFFAAMQARDWERARSLIAADALIRWTSSGEAFQGRRFVDVNEAYPEGWEIDVRELLGEGERVAAEVCVTLGETTFWLAGFYIVAKGRIAGGREHWVTAGSESVPAWREPFQHSA